jgi:hypothetical protein
MRMEDYPSGSFVAAALIAAYFAFVFGSWFFGLVAVVMLYYAVRNWGRLRT